MTISIGGSSSGSVTTGTTLTISHTCNAGSNCLIASVGYATAATVGTVTATYNGVSMTSIDRRTVGTQEAIETFRLFSPPTGSAYNIVFTVSKTIIVALGVDQDFGGVDIAGTPFGTVANGTNTTGTQSTLAITCSTNDVAYGFLYHGNTNNAVTVDSQTEIAEVNVTSTAVAGYKTSPAASQNMRWSWTTNAAWMTHGFAIKPSNDTGFFLFF